MTPTRWTRVRIDVAGSDSDSDDTDDCGLTTLGGCLAGPDQHSSTALTCTDTAPRLVLVDAD